jgi:hypothetical protein
MRTARTPYGEFRTSHAGTANATLWFVPSGPGPKDVAFPGLTAADLRAIASMAVTEADEMDPAQDTETVQARLTGSPHGVAVAAGLITARLGSLVGHLTVKNRTERLAQGYLTVAVPKGTSQ